MAPPHTHQSGSLAMSFRLSARCPLFAAFHRASHDAPLTRYLFINPPSPSPAPTSNRRHKCSRTSMRTAHFVNHARQRYTRPAALGWPGHHSCTAASKYRLHGGSIDSSNEAVVLATPRNEERAGETLNNQLFQTRPLLHWAWAVPRPLTAPISVHTQPSHLHGLTYRTQ